MKQIRGIAEQAERIKNRLVKYKADLALILELQDDWIPETKIGRLRLLIRELPLKLIRFKVEMDNLSAGLFRNEDVYSQGGSLLRGFNDDIENLQSSNGISRNTLTNFVVRVMEYTEKANRMKISDIWSVEQFLVMLGEKPSRECSKTILSAAKLAYYKRIGAITKLQEELERRKKWLESQKKERKPKYN